jgi:hypothetical protein
MYESEDQVGGDLLYIAACLEFYVKFLTLSLISSMINKRDKKKLLLDGDNINHHLSLLYY